MVRRLRPYRRPHRFAGSGHAPAGGRYPATGDSL